MIMKLELPPELHAGLLSQAREERLSPEAYATQVLEDRTGSREANCGWFRIKP